MQDIPTASATLNEDNATLSTFERQVVVMEHGYLARYRLPTAGIMRIGRSEPSDISLRDPAASRAHAVLHIGEQLELEDVGSHNGTLLHNQRLEPRRRVSVALGDSIRIGSAILIVQRGKAPSADGGKGDQESPDAAARPVVDDPAMRDLYRLVERVAISNINVLVLGETGVGKEFVAEAIHRHSGRRSSGPLVRVNCAALSPALFESELFGHQQGAFTGAIRAKPGLLEAADKGTVFLDEVGELPLALQAKLLRVIESREVTRVGAVRPMQVDLRFVAATNRNLHLEAQRGDFREDLFFRLSGMSVSVPSLRERKSEIMPLVTCFASRIAAELGKPTPAVAPAAEALLIGYAWPGNVRELRNAIECAVVLANGATIEPVHLPAPLSDNAARAERSSPEVAATTAGGTPTTIPSPGDVKLTPRQHADRDRILSGLAACNGNQTRAADYLGIPRRTLVAKLAAYSIPRPRKLTNDAKR